MSLYDDRLQRTMNAIHMKPVDKIPFSYNGPAYMARNQGLTIGKYINDYKAATDAAISFVKQHPGIDSLNTPTFCPYSQSLTWLSEVRVPGVDLPEDELWQVVEKENMTLDDYEKIVEIGYAPWVEDYLKNRVGDPMSKRQAHVDSAAETYRRVTKEAEIPIMNRLASGTPFECFCGGRQLMNFFVDLVSEPELVKKAMDCAFEHMYNNFMSMIDNMKPISVWIGGWRAAPSLLSHDTWMEFVWPYLEKMILGVIEHHSTPLLHFDSCWDRELETLKQLPARQCLLMLDGATDIYKAKEVLDDRMCLMGDVPSTKLAFGSDTEVYEYTGKLIRDIGPKTGLIISSGCDAPLNAKDENVNAMIQATIDYHVS